MPAVFRNCSRTTSTLVWSRPATQQGSSMPWTTCSATHDFASAWVQPHGALSRHHCAPLTSRGGPSSCMNAPRVDRLRNYAWCGFASGNELVEVGLVEIGDVDPD